jgi:hypothetical protein
MRTSPALLVGFLVVGAACGGGGGSGKSAAKQSTTAEAQQRAEAIVLKRSDLPESWGALTPSAGDVARAAKFRRCIGAESHGPTPTGEARSELFTKLGDVTGAYSEAQITTNIPQAKERFLRYVEGVSRAASNRCFHQAIGKRQILPGIPSADPHELGAADVRDLHLRRVPAVEEVRAWEVVIPVRVTSGPTKGVSASVYFDAVLLRNGNRLAYVQTSDVASPADSGLRDQLVRTVAARMSAD